MPLTTDERYGAKTGSYCYYQMLIQPPDKDFICFQMQNDRWTIANYQGRLRIKEGNELPNGHGSPEAAIFAWKLANNE